MPLAGYYHPRGCKHSQRKMFTMSILKRFEQDGLEILIDTNSGESFASVKGYARMSGKDKSTISRRLQGVALGSPKTAQILTEGGGQGIRTIPEHIYLDWLIRDNPTIFDDVVCFIKNTTNRDVAYPRLFSAEKKKYRHPEKKVQKRLAKRLNGKMEVSCKTGTIDIMTETEIIEVKKAKDWKHAVGQSLVYQLEYPHLQPRIHLYEECSEEFKSMVVSFCSRLNIIATFE